MSINADRYLRYHKNRSRFQNVSRIQHPKLWKVKRTLYNSHKMKRVANTTSQQFRYPKKIEKTKNKENNYEQITKEKCQKANSSTKLIYIAGWSCPPLSLKTGGPTKVLTTVEV